MSENKESKLKAAADNIQAMLRCSEDGECIPVSKSDALQLLAAARSFSEGKWLDLGIDQPEKAGTYLVAGAGSGKVGQARWMPRKGAWVFPSAASAFLPTHWMPLPEAPK